ncbi:hypothetical protein PRZ48_006229 [Zasmidium cellare]|uniref:Uncharacterized protein n=1 Tax=Zasmidium cellare TaxID=395010 RepID=A0ABR0ENP3_ZASCE|nr:hypothetical protein PRZ48_006229 [Zasmidium cellare]
MSQQVTGMTAFWAVLALALNAMARPSFASKMLYDQDTSSESALITHLSSPIVCLVDCLFELMVLGRTAWRLCCKPQADSLPGQAPSPTTHKPKHDSIAVRTVLFILGGLPQAVKMSSMRGIPLTQTLSAVFLASTVLATISELLSARTEVEKKAISSWLRENRQTSDLLRASVFLAHGFMAATAWHIISSKLVLHRDTPGIIWVDIALFTGSISALVGLLITLAWILGVLLAPMAFVRLFKVLVSPTMACLPFVLLFSYPRKLLEAGDRARDGKQKDTTLISMVWDTVPLLLLAASGSYILAAALVRVKNSLTRARTDALPSSHDSEPQSQVNAQSPPPPMPGEGSATSSSDAQEKSDVHPVQDLLKTGTITLLLPIRGYLERTDDKNNQVSAADLSQQNATATETVYPHPQQDAQPQFTTQTISSNSTPESSTQKRTKNRYRVSDTHWNWLLVGYSFWNFRDKIPAAYRHIWKNTASPLSTKIPACLSLSWEILKLFAFQSIWFAGFAIVNVFDVSPIDRFCGRIARKVDAGTGKVWFAIFNLATAACYYAVAFDGTGTVNPGWTGVLGRR